MESVFNIDNVVFQEKIHYPKIEIKAKKLTFISGASGSGKSTLFKLLNATQPLSSGRILYNDVDINTIDTVLLRREVLLVGQSVYLFNKTIDENFEEFYAYRDLPKPENESILEYLTLCLADFPLNTRCVSMSGGERQRVFLALCLSLLPKVLMLDEPTSALDSACAYQLLANVKQFCMEHEITLLIISHDKALISEYADEIITLEKGK